MFGKDLVDGRRLCQEIGHNEVPTIENLLSFDYG